MSRVESTSTPVRRSAFSRHWTLEPGVSFLNHGSFGACPSPVLRAQAEYRAMLEAEPVRFFVEQLEPMLDESRTALAAFVDCSSDDLAFVPNATAGVNTVLRSLEFESGDELLTTNHEYNACQNALRFTASKFGATVVTAEVPFPIQFPRQVLDNVLECVTPRTRLALLSVVTSPTAMAFPIRELVRELSLRGVATLVDAAHAPGMIELNIGELGATYVTGNCHKWMCAPKGAGFLWVQRECQASIRPLSISHGANSSRTDRSRFLIEFGWTGTADPTPFLAVKDAIQFMASLLPTGWAGLRQANSEKARAARDVLCRELGVEPPVPDDMLGSMASVPLPDSTEPPSGSSLYADPLQMRLVKEWAIQVPIVQWPTHPRRLVRVSAQLYNDPSEYEALGRALTTICGAANSVRTRA